MWLGTWDHPGFHTGIFFCVVVVVVVVVVVWGAEADTIWISDRQGRA